MNTLLDWAYFFLHVAIVIMCFSIAKSYILVKKEANDIKAYEIRVTTPNDEEAIKSLDKLIEDTLIDYVLLNKAYKENRYINSVEERKILDEVTKLVRDRISPIILDKLNFIYSESGTYEVIGTKVYERVISYVIDNNKNSKK